MNPIKYCLLISVLTSSVLAQESGFFFSAGGGIVRMSVDGFSVYNPVASIPGQPLGEALPALDRNETTAMTRLTLGYAFSPSWDLRLSYSYYGTNVVPMAFPLYPGMVFVTAPDPYLRHAFVYKTSSFTLMPTYNFVLSDNLKVRAGVGVNCSTTAAHFEDTRRGTISGDIRHNRHAEFEDTDLAYVLSLGVDYRITEKVSAGLNATYTTMSAEIPTVPWVNRTKSRVNIDALSAELALTWHW